MEPPTPRSGVLEFGTVLGTWDCSFAHLAERSWNYYRLGFTRFRYEVKQREGGAR